MTTAANAPVAVYSETRPLENRTRRIRDLNDHLRQTFTGGRVLITAGVQALDQTMLGDLLVLIKKLDQFDAGNDPFGGARLCGAGYLWKIDYYDRKLNHGSPNPADDELTARVLTIMREDEY